MNSLSLRIQILSSHHSHELFVKLMIYTPKYSIGTFLVPFILEVDSDRVGVEEHHKAYTLPKFAITH
jgi:hypothetical protein